MLMKVSINPKLNPIKGEGCGNTFLIFDCLEKDPSVLEEIKSHAHQILIEEKRDDALILIKEYENQQKLILKMVVLEPDGSIAEFCGNGARVVSCYLHKKFKQKRTFYLKTSKGVRKVWKQNEAYYVEMGPTYLHYSSNKFLKRKLETFQLGLGIKLFTFFWTETLEPHLITFDMIEENELRDLGLYLNHNQRDFFPLGINLNRVKLNSNNTLSVMTFERGLNRITAACGTGATSSVILAQALGYIKKKQKIEVVLKGGRITIYPKNGKAIMSGPATVNFKG